MLVSITQVHDKYYVKVTERYLGIFEKERYVGYDFDLGRFEYAKRHLSIEAARVTRDVFVGSEKVIETQVVGKEQPRKCDEVNCDCGGYYTEENS